MPLKNEEPPTPVSRHQSSDRQIDDKTDASYCSLTEDSISAANSYLKGKYDQQPPSAPNCSQTSSNLKLEKKIDELQHSMSNLDTDSCSSSFHTAKSRSENQQAMPNNKIEHICRSGTSIDLKILCSDSYIHPLTKSRSYHETSSHIQTERATQLGPSTQNTDRRRQSTERIIGSHTTRLSDTLAAIPGYVTSNDIIDLSQRSSLQRTQSLPADLHKTPSIPVCPICLDTISYCVRTNCAHIFCAPCLLMVWEMQRNKFYPVMCPYCRRSVSNIREIFTVLEEAEETEVKLRITEDLQFYNRRFYDGPKTWLQTLQDIPMYLIRIWDSDLGGLLIRWLLFRAAAEVAIYVYHYFNSNNLTSDTEAFEMTDGQQ